MASSKTFETSLPLLTIWLLDLLPASLVIMPIPLSLFKVLFVYLLFNSQSLALPVETPMSETSNLVREVEVVTKTVRVSLQDLTNYNTTSLANRPKNVSYWNWSSLVSSFPLRQ